MKKRTFKLLKCHPKYKKYDLCLNEDIVMNMRDNWNQKNPHKLIKTRKKKNIINTLRRYLSVCSHQKCLVDNTLDMKMNLFAPISPSSWNSNKSEWLSSVDIVKVMKQYEETYPQFRFLGPTPIDFDEKYGSRCIWPEICNLSIKGQLRQQKKYIGIIFNLDTHDKSGSHWVCMFINLENKYILYLDSNGLQMPKPIYKLTKRIVNECHELNIDMKVYTNKMRHQYEDGECGMYCLYTIVQLLEKKHKVQYFLTHRISDHKMNAYRNIFYNKMI
jgi:hypothetical protein